MPKNDPPYPGTYDNLHIRWEFIINRLKKGPPFPPGGVGSDDTVDPGKPRSFPVEPLDGYEEVPLVKELMLVWLGSTRKRCLDLGGGNSNICSFFTPKIGEDSTILTNIFSDGLKPPTSCSLGGRKKLQPKHGGGGDFYFVRLLFLKAKDKRSEIFFFLGGEEFYLEIFRESLNKGVLKRNFLKSPTSSWIMMMIQKSPPGGFSCKSEEKMT